MASRRSGHRRRRRPLQLGQRGQNRFERLPVPALDASGLQGFSTFGRVITWDRRGAGLSDRGGGPGTLDQGVEDLCLKDDLYRMIMAEFLRRLELRHQEAGRPREG